MPQLLPTSGTHTHCYEVFEWLVMMDINACLRQDLDPLQFIHRHNSLAVDAILLDLLCLDHEANKNMLVRLFF